MKPFYLFNILERVGSRGWRGTLESTRRLVGLYNRVLLAVTGGYAKGHCIAIYTMSKRIIGIYKKSGPIHAGKYLKQVSYCLQRVIACEKSDYTLGVYVSLTRGGIPRFIPSIYRKRLCGDNPDPVVVKVVLSVCTLHKLMAVLPVNKVAYNLSTIDPVGFPLLTSVLDTIKWVRSSGGGMLERLVPKLREIPLQLGYQCTPLLSASPLSVLKYQEGSFWANFGLGKMFSSCLTPYHLLALDAFALVWCLDERVLQQYSRLWFVDRVLYAGDTSKSQSDALKDDAGAFVTFLDNFKRSVYFSYENPEGLPLGLGRLCRKIEGAGKVRNFAIGNQFLQRLLYPLHEYSMSVLSKIPTDGTYNQLKPLQRLKGQKVLYSYDLKAATDLLPAELSQGVIHALFGAEMGRSWLRLMTTVVFLVPSGRTGGQPFRAVRFTRGQPLGFYSSWAVFSLTHHVLVGFAASLVYPGKRFLNYAILGDDLVIGDAKVATAYADLIQRGGGVISYDKSIVSIKGCCEFAKRFIMFNHLDKRVDASPVSMPLLKLLDRFVNPIVYTSLGASIRASFRLRHAGYRVYSQIDGNKSLKVIWRCLSKRWRRQLVGLYSPSGPKSLPLLLWLTFPDFWVLDCYIEGSLYHLLLEWMGSRGLDDESFQSPRLLLHEEDEPFLEAHYAPLVLRYVEFVIWKAQASIGMFTLEELTRPKVPLFKLSRNTDRKVLQRYGYNYRLWDVAQSLRFAKPGILDSGANLGMDIPNIRIFRVKPYSWVQLFLELNI